MLDIFSRLRQRQSCQCVASIVKRMDKNKRGFLSSLSTTAATTTATTAATAMATTTTTTAAATAAMAPTTATAAAAKSQQEAIAISQPIIRHQSIAARE